MLIEALYITEGLGTARMSFTGRNSCTNSGFHTMETFSAMTRNKLLIETTAWMERKGLKLSEKSGSQKNIYFMTP